MLTSIYNNLKARIILDIKDMKIVFIGCRDIDTIIGGIETYMKQLCYELCKHDDIEVVLYMGSYKNERLVENNLTLVRQKISQNKYFNKILIGFISTINALKYDSNATIFHYNANIAGLFSFIPILLGKKVVFMGHGFEWKRTKWNSCIRFVNKIIDDFVIRINKNILMCSNEQVNYIKRRYNNKHVMFAPSGIYMLDNNY
jgi:hypothetical protein